VLGVAVQVAYRNLVIIALFGCRIAQPVFHSRC
jgi:hypothetical protein